MKAKLARRWFDISSKELARILGSFRARDFDLIPFGTFALSRDGKVHDWIPDPAAVVTGRRPGDFRGKSFFAEVNPTLFITSFQEEFYRLYEQDTFDETFYFTFRFPGEWRQARVRIADDGSGLIRLTMVPIRRIADAGDKENAERRIA